MDDRLLARRDRLRRRCQAGLNKGEARHFLAHAVYVHRQGRITDRTFENQSYRASGLNLAIAAIVYWNTVYMQRAVGHLRSTGAPLSRTTCLPTPHRPRPNIRTTRGHKRTRDPQRRTCRLIGLGLTWRGSPHAKLA